MKTIQFNRPMWQGVNSSAIAAVAYDKTNKVLFVLYKRGKIYSYDNVSDYKFKQLLNSESIGSYLNRSIKQGDHSYKEIL